MATIGNLDPVTMTYFHAYCAKNGLSMNREISKMLFNFLHDKGLIDISHKPVYGEKGLQKNRQGKEPKQRIVNDQGVYRYDHGQFGHLDEVKEDDGEF